MSWWAKNPNPDWTSNQFYLAFLTLAIFQKCFILSENLKFQVYRQKLIYKNLTCCGHFFTTQKYDTICYMTPIKVSNCHVVLFLFQILNLNTENTTPKIYFKYCNITKIIVAKSLKNSMGTSHNKLSTGDTSAIMFEVLK